MKKFLIPALALVLLAGCSKSDDNPGQPQGPEDLSIVMSSGITALPVGRAPVENGAGTDLPSSAVDMFFLRAADAPTVDWTTADGTNAVTGGFSSGRVPARMATTGAITFTPSQFYNNNAANYSHFIGYYPAGSPSYTAGTGTTITWAINGANDILLSQYVNGNKANKQGAANVHLAPRFQHQLSWIDFHVMAAAGEDIDAIKETYGKIESISIVGVPTTATSVLTAAAGARPAITFSTTTAPLVTLAPTANTAALAADITATKANFSYAMIPPRTSMQVIIATEKHTVTLPVRVTGTWYDPSPTDLEASRGAKSEVVVTFHTNQITAEGTIEEWTTGDSGEVEVE